MTAAPFAEKMAGLLPRLVENERWVEYVNSRHGQVARSHSALPRWLHAVSSGTWNFRASCAFCGFRRSSTRHTNRAFGRDHAKQNGRALANALLSRTMSASGGRRHTGVRGEVGV